MKITKFILLLVTLIACKKEGKDIPASVTEAFKNKYPNAVAKEWEKEDGAFETKTVLNDIEYEVAFDANGAWLETERDIKLTELPQAVRDSLAAGSYKDWEVKGTVEIESPKYPKAFELEVGRGESKASLYFTPDGILVEVEQAENEDNEDDEDDKD